VDLVTWAEGEARRLLEPLGGRWVHSRAVAARAGEIGHVCDASERALLVAAGLLHDAGYAPELWDSGFHPLDGGRWLRRRGEERLAGLVAHHTGARFEAEGLGLARELAAFADEASVVSDALTYCDLTTGPAGEPLTATERLQEIERRYGAESNVVRSLRRASETLFAAVERVEQRLGRASVL
jgi:hypothetical protein